MGLIRDAATAAVRDVIKGSLVVGGITALSGAVNAAENIGEKIEAKKTEKVIKKAAKEAKKVKRDAKIEEIKNLALKPTTLLNKYSHNLIALCADKSGTRTYVFTTVDNQIKYMTNGDLNESCICLYNYDEKLIGKVAIEDSEGAGTGIKKFSKKLSLIIENSKIGSVEIAVTEATKTIKLSTYFWNVWVKAGDIIVEEKEFKISPYGLIPKKIYQISYNDQCKEVILALTYIGLNEAKQILKDQKI